MPTHSVLERRAGKALDWRQETDSTDCFAFGSQVWLMKRQGPVALAWSLSESRSAPQ